MPSGGQEPEKKAQLSPVGVDGGRSGSLDVVVPEKEFQKSAQPSEFCFKSNRWVTGCLEQLNLPEIPLNYGENRWVIRGNRWVIVVPRGLIFVP